MAQLLTAVFTIEDSLKETFSPILGFPELAYKGQCCKKLLQTGLVSISAQHFPVTEKYSEF